MTAPRLPGIRSSYTPQRPATPPPPPPPSAEDLYQAAVRRYVRSVRAFTEAHLYARAMSGTWGAPSG